MTNSPFENIWLLAATLYFAALANVDEDSGRNAHDCRGVGIVHEEERAQIGKASIMAACGSVPDGAQACFDMYRYISTRHTSNLEYEVLRAGATERETCTARSSGNKQDSRLMHVTDCGEPLKLPHSRSLTGPSGSKHTKPIYDVR